MHIIDLALKDLSQIVRDRKTAVNLVAMPIVFTLFFGLIFGATGGSSADARLPVGFVNQDAGEALGNHLLALLKASDAIRPVVLEGDQIAKAPTAVRDEKLAALVIVPESFSQTTWAGQEQPLSVVADNAKPASHMAATAVRVALSRLQSAVRLAQLSAEASAASQPFTDDAARQAYLDQAVARTLPAWQDPPLSVRVQQGPPTQNKTTLNNSYLQASPGMIVQFAINGLMTTGTMLVLERRSRTLQRLLTTPITRAEVIAGKVLAMFLLVFLQETLLVAVGQLAFGVGYLRAPLAILLVMIALALWAASLGLLIGAISRGEEQVIMWTLIAMFILSAMGGAWFPLEFTGQTFSTIGHLLPTAWAMDGFQNIILRGLGLASVVTPVLVLLGYAGVCLGLAVWRFRFE